MVNPGRCCGATVMPAVRIDLGFITSPTDAQLLAKPGNLTAAADAAVAALAKFFAPLS